MALGRTAKYYRENPEARKKHMETSTKWNKSEDGKAYKKAKNNTPQEKKKYIGKITETRELLWNTTFQMKYIQKIKNYINWDI